MKSDTAPNNYIDEEKLLIKHHLVTIHDLTVRNNMELLSSDINNENEAFKIRMLMRHAFELNNLY